MAGVSGSPPELLALHAVRLLGFAPTARVASRFDLDESWVGEQLEDHRARGRVTWSAYGDVSGWSLTQLGRVEDEAALARELEATERRDLVHRSYLEFLELNAGVLRAVTDWQTRPVAGDPLAANDHHDLRWDTRALHRLADLGGRLAPLAGALEAVLDRLGGYSVRFESALARARAGHAVWVDGLGIDSCHTVWFQLHEDLLATLGIPRGHEPG